MARLEESVVEDMEFEKRMSSLRATNSRGESRGDNSNDPLISRGVQI